MKIQIFIKIDLTSKCEHSLVKMKVCFFMGFLCLLGFIFCCCGGGGGLFFFFSLGTEKVESLAKMIGEQGMITVTFCCGLSNLDNQT